ncbi:hypothetical protein BC939DRAFT_466462 [Gamsiella multidivaricata]|uniref:uncharacterized protein n=1 Tax=Gamsiella multidivaricata TaxID=101098 RepID=UPI00221F5F53|nr:uncharacterized protein BC939DRAFT_466462 [Gamsiella multidivaricata]KAG0361818.1 hypothetical protein BGZ54_008930 [Gamsiella multidivaricata]KAI7817282.1 hypothetical protein BC939DRAFT_466462 [Gamsiella multidivaricata]
MKFTTTLLIATTTLAAYVNADMIQINNPTAGTVWTAGVSNFVGWTGNCASMGEPAKNVTVILNTGPSDAVRYVATLGTLDCSGSSTRTDLTVPLSVPTGTYSIVVRTDPQLSYTNMFTINNPSSPEAGTSTAPSSAAAPPAADGSGSAPAPTAASAVAHNGGENVKANAMAVGLGAVVLAASQLLM